MLYLSSLRGMSTNIFTINSSFYPLRPLFIYSPGSHLLIHTRIVVRSRIRRISSLSFYLSLARSPFLTHHVRDFESHSRVDQPSRAG